MAARLFLIFSHELDALQMQDAREHLGITEFVYLTDEAESNKLLSTVRHIPAEASPDELQSIAAAVIRWLENRKAGKDDYILIQTEFGLTFLLVDYCLNHQLKPVYSTHNKTEEPRKHIQFRTYNRLKIMSNSSVIFYRAINALHFGTSEGEGYIDKPVQKEVHTKLPKIVGQSMRGAYRNHFRVTNFRPDSINDVFGPEDTTHAGAITINDVYVLLFPVASVVGTYALITCPSQLAKLQYLSAKTGGKQLTYKNFPSEPNIDTIYCSPNSEVCYWPEPQAGVATGEAAAPAGFAVFNDIRLNAQPTEFTINNIHFSEFFADIVSPKSKTPGEEFTAFFNERYKEQICIVHDEVFSLLVEAGLEVLPGIKINPDTGTVSSTALFYTEYIPEETILFDTVNYNTILSARNVLQPEDKTREHVRNIFLQHLTTNDVMTGGGKKGTGSGTMHIKPL